LSDNLLTKSILNVQSCQVSRSEYQGEGDPGSQWAGEHLQAAIDDQGYEEEIHHDHKGNEDQAGTQRRGEVELAEVDQRNDGEDDWRGDRVHDQSAVDGHGGHANHHCGGAKCPADESMGQDD